MKINRAITVCFFLCVFTLSGCVRKEMQIIGSGKYRDSSLARVQINKKLVVGVSDQFPPLVYKDEDGVLVGYDVELAREVARRIGVPVEFKVMGEKSLPPAVVNGGVDCIWAGFKKTPVHDKLLSLSSVYLRSADVLVIRNSFRISDPEQIKTDKIGLIRERSHAALIELRDKHGGFTKLKQYHNAQVMFEALYQGEVAGIISDLLTVFTMKQRYPDALQIIGDPLVVSDYVIGFKKGEDALKNEIEQVLYAMFQEQVIANITKKWFEMDISSFGK